MRAMFPGASVAVAQLVERWIVAPAVAGSIPVGHPRIEDLRPHPFGSSQAVRPPASARSSSTRCAATPWAQWRKRT